MREIKFRVYDKAIKKMHVVGSDTHDSFTCFNGDVQYYNLQNGEGSGEHGDYKLMQFTGLKDKNGKEIYEGDVVNVPMHDDWSGVVVFTGDCQYALKGRSTSGNDAYLLFSQIYLAACEVIGNIYENHELLKEAVE
jgi:uncharacterized phage protein (TIGR01671 family)